MPVSARSCAPSGRRNRGRRADALLHSYSHRHCRGDMPFASGREEPLLFIFVFAEAAITLIEVLRSPNPIHRARAQWNAKCLDRPVDDLGEEMELAIDRRRADVLIEPVVDVSFDVGGYHLRDRFVEPPKPTPRNATRTTDGAC
jgi:hypothetical protein